MHVLVTGRTGFIATALLQPLLATCHSVTVLSRKPASTQSLFQGRVQAVRSANELPSDARFDAIVNLAGAPVVGPPWTAGRRQVLLDSRVGVTESLLAWLQRATHRPAVWVQASAIGFYGVRPPHEVLTETSAAGGGFMSELCVRWEAAAAKAQAQHPLAHAQRLGLGRSRFPAHAQLGHAPAARGTAFGQHFVRGAHALHAHARCLPPPRPAVRAALPPS